MIRYCFAILFLFTQSYSQQLVVLEHADEIEGREEKNFRIRELKGNVSLLQSDLKIKCDRAIQNLTTNEIDLFGNVKILRSNLIINTKQARYNANKKVSYFNHGIELFRGKFFVESNFGIYLVEDGVTEFKGNVKSRDSVSVINCENLKYFEKEEKAIATENVLVRNNENSLKIISGRMEHFENKNYSKFTLSPLFMQVDTLENGKIDTLVVEGKILEVYNDKSQTMIANGNVKLAKGDLSAICEDLKFEQNEGRITFLQNPVLWFNNSQITGDTIISKLEDKKIKELEVKRKAFMLTQNDTIADNKYDQMSGKKIIMNFESNDLKKISIIGNATSLYFLYDDEKPKGVNKTSGDKIDLYFSDGLLETISIKKGAEGNYYPEKMVKRNLQEINLEGFKILKDKPTINKIIGGKFAN